MVGDAPMQVSRSVMGLNPLTKRGDGGEVREDVRLPEEKAPGL